MTTNHDYYSFIDALLTVKLSSNSYTEKERIALKAKAGLIVLKTTAVAFPLKLGPMYTFEDELDNLKQISRSLEHSRHSSSCDILHKRKEKKIDR